MIIGDKRERNSMNSPLDELKNWLLEIHCILKFITKDATTSRVKVRQLYCTAQTVQYTNGDIYISSVDGPDFGDNMQV